MPNWAHLDESPCRRRCLRMSVVPRWALRARTRTALGATGAETCAKMPVLRVPSRSGRPARSPQQRDSRKNRQCHRCSCESAGSEPVFNLSEPGAPILENCPSMDAQNPKLCGTGSRSAVVEGSFVQSAWRDGTDLALALPSLPWASSFTMSEVMKNSVNLLSRANFRALLIWIGRWVEIPQRSSGERV